MSNDFPDTIILDRPASVGETHSTQETTAEHECSTRFEILVPPDLPTMTAPTALMGSLIGADLRSILRTRENVRDFVSKMDVLVTCVFPGSRAGDGLLRECLETATRLYIAAANGPFNADVAKFMAAAICIASSGLATYRASAPFGDARLNWDPVADGNFRDFLARTNAPAVRFEVRGMPSVAQRQAAKHLVVARTCTFDDVASMQRAGIDYLSFDVCGA